MSVQVICDFCDKGEEAPGGRWMTEIRGITAGNDSQLYRSDYAQAQVHWACLIPWAERENAKEEEPPF